MPYLVLVEPAEDQRVAFARWCLAQTPKIMTLSASGSEVPADLFATMPGELLEGAYVDGHIYRHVIDGMVPDGDGYKPEVPVNEGARPEPLSVPKPKPQRRTRVRQHPTGKAVGK